MLDGPTSLEVARTPSQWYVRSQEFFTAGEVLLEKRNASIKTYYEKHVGRQVTAETKANMRFMNLHTPIIFNLAFACELLVKAILVQQDPERWIPETGRVAFDHDVHTLIVENIRIELDDLEAQIARRLRDYISYGKYPEETRPGDVQRSLDDLFNYHPYVNWSLKEYFEIISSLWNKLSNYFLELANH